MTQTLNIMEDLNRFALEVLGRAGEKALTYYGKGREGLKFDQQLVTEAELELIGFFRERMEDRFPDHRLFSDALEDRSYSHGEGRYLWVFDPVDGVANFQGGIPLWGISLAILENFWPVFGAFYMPATNDLFHARAGGQAFWGKSEIRPSSRLDIDDESVLFTYSRFHNRYKTSFPGKIRGMGCTGAHLCYVATGRADGAVIHHQTYQDLAAVRVILEASGMKLFRMNGEELAMNEAIDGTRLDLDLLAASPANVQRILRCLEATG